MEKMNSATDLKKADLVIYTITDGGTIKVLQPFYNSALTKAVTKEVQLKGINNQQLPDDIKAKLVIDNLEYCAKQNQVFPFMESWEKGGVAAPEIRPVEDYIEALLLENKVPAKCTVDRQRGDHYLLCKLVNKEANRALAEHVGKKPSQFPSDNEMLGEDEGYDVDDLEAEDEDDNNKNSYWPDGDESASRAGVSTRSSSSKVSSAGVAKAGQQVLHQSKQQPGPINKESSDESEKNWNDVFMLLSKEAVRAYKELEASSNGIQSLKKAWKDQVQEVTSRARKQHAEDSKALSRFKTIVTKS